MSTIMQSLYPVLSYPSSLSRKPHPRICSPSSLFFYSLSCVWLCDSMDHIVILEFSASSGITPIGTEIHLGCCEDLEFENWPSRLCSMLCGRMMIKLPGFSTPPCIHVLYSVIWHLSHQEVESSFSSIPCIWVCLMSCLASRTQWKGPWVHSEPKP